MPKNKKHYTNLNKNTLLSCFKKPATIFIHFLFFCNTLLRFAENTITVVFSANTDLKNTISNKTLFHPSPKHLFKKGVIFGFEQFLLKPLFYRCSWFGLFWPPTFLAKTDSVHSNARLSPFLTQIVCQAKPKQTKNFLIFFIILMTTFKNTIL